MFENSQIKSHFSSLPVTSNVETFSGDFQTMCTAFRENAVELLFRSLIHFKSVVISVTHYEIISECEALVLASWILVFFVLAISLVS